MPVPWLSQPPGRSGGAFAGPGRRGSLAPTLRERDPARIYTRRAPGRLPPRRPAVPREAY